MIGLFDSGFGGLWTLKIFSELLPQYDYILLSDAEHNPYGVKTPEEIKDLTYRSINRLFRQGAKIVILACNTASAYAIRSWQTDFPDKKVLSVMIPGIEAVSQKGYKKIGILATRATITSGIYETKLLDLSENRDLEVTSVTAQELVGLVEEGDHEKIQHILPSILSQLPTDMECLILGCTHFPIISFGKKNYEIIDPSLEAGMKLADYLERHPEIQPSKQGKVKIYTTGNVKKYCEVGKHIFPKIECVSVKKAYI